MTKPVCLVTGVGPGTGSACVRRFAKDYRVAMMARNETRLGEISESVEDAFAFPCDVTDTEALHGQIARIRAELGDPEVLVHNAVGGAFGTFLEIEPEVLEQNFQVNTMALLHLGRALAPNMIERGRGSIMITANTAAYRGVAHFAGFAPTKAAQRILAEAMARDLGPKGVHVGLIAIDAVIDLAWTRKRYAGKDDDFFCQPDDIAEEVYRLAHQPKSAWTFSSVIRPFGETWSLNN
ncbi:MAG: NAD(P)-dependent dehydrogenase (short-subunit alcohol dehydrogenase family) [Limisphaerales bacterium]|jgi:NAD(P)-dependent dehydrogenase (short-subunit alcohol dehydrogenase family)